MARSLFLEDLFYRLCGVELIVPPLPAYLDWRPDGAEPACALRDWPSAAPPVALAPGGPGKTG